jgi:hypothetical protein
MAPSTLTILSSRDAIYLRQYDLPFQMSRDRLVSVATGYALDDQGSVPVIEDAGNVYSYPHRANWLWGPLSLFFKGHLLLFAQGNNKTGESIYPITFT